MDQPGLGAAWTVFEAMNETSKELFVGATGLSLEHLHAQHRGAPPAEIGHWSFAEHKIVYREIERGIPEPDLKAFIDGYARSIEKRGWKTIIQR